MNYKQLFKIMDDTFHHDKYLLNPFMPNVRNYAYRGKMDSQSTFNSHTNLSLSRI